MLVAISVEHERDHVDGPALPREGCNGCKMIEYAWVLEARVAAAEAERDGWRDNWKRACEERNALLDKIAALTEALEGIIYASDQCRGHRDCGYSMELWARARAALREAPPMRSE